MSTSSQRIAEGGAAPRPEMAWVPSATFRMGSNDHYPEEAPVHAVEVDGFWIDRLPVTNGEFAAFVSETAYITVAERALDPAGSSVRSIRPTFPAHRLRTSCPAPSSSR